MTSSWLALVVMLQAAIAVPSEPVHHPCPSRTTVAKPGSELAPPRILRRYIPELPPWGTRELIENRDFLFRVVITEEGAACDIRSLEGPRFHPPWPELEAAYADALSRFVFQPAQRDDQNVPGRLDVTMAFYPYPEEPSQDE